jgi:hypothetical protein
MRDPIRFLVLLLFAVVLAGTVVASETTYRNEEFGIYIAIPQGVQLCLPRKEQHDHGPVFLLEHAANNAGSEITLNRVIVIFAGYNANDTTKRLNNFLDDLCDNIGKGKRVEAPPRLEVNGLPSVAAMVVRSDGWIDVFVATQAGKADPAFDPLVPSINYDLRLHTTAEHLEEDLGIFRTLLKTVTISPPDSAALGRK